ncbi:MAG: DUF4430 domain-containing protein [Lachnospiraceae bacterium]|nr:DUF4430 domain-containing protein [Lachnospiraceae bacterium]
MKKFSRRFSLILCSLLLAAMTFTAVGCSKKEKETEAAASNELKDGATLGEGSKSFTLEVVDLDKKELSATIKTDAATVGEALLDLEIVDGEDSDFGLYVTTVNGLTLDYDKDGKYWAFYIDGEYASTGVDSTDIEEGKVYRLAAE